MKLSQISSPEFITTFEPNVEDKWQLIPWLVEFALNRYQEVYSQSLSHSQIAEVTEAVLERERSMTTGIGEKLAIPHASVSFLEQPLAALCVFSEGFDFEAMDKKEVSVVILLLIPKDHFQEHIETLANVARLAHKSEFLEEISSMRNTEQIFETILEYEV